MIFLTDDRGDRFYASVPPIEVSKWVAVGWEDTGSREVIDGVRLVLIEWVGTGQPVTPKP